MPIPTPTAQAASSVSNPRAREGSSLLPGVGTLFLLVAVGAACMLAAHRLGGLAIPGCGGGGACDKVTKGPWGSIPWLHWPVSYLGAAYFLGMLAAWVTVRGRPTNAMRWLARLGALASMMFIGVMLSDNTICPYCLTSHAANLLFVIVCEVSGTTAGAAAGVPTLLAVASMATAVLGMAELRQHEENALSQAASIEKMKNGMAQQGAQPATKGAPGATGTTGAAAPAQPTAAAAGAGDTAAFTGRYRLGPANAPIRIVMITDYQCPDCRHFEAQAMQLVKERSDVSLSIKHFPFCTACNNTPNVPNLHPNACMAARAAETAGRLYGPDGFWKMHSWLFEHKGEFDDGNFAGFLTSLGFEPVKFQQTMLQIDTLALVQDDIKEAASLGIRATPMMFVNEVEVKGWGSDALALRNAVMALAKQPPAAAQQPKIGRPPTAAEKDAADALEILDNWRDVKKTPAMAWPLRKQPWTVVPETAPIRISLFGDLLEPNCAQADKTIRDAIAGRNDIRYEFRYFPFDQTCNPQLPRTMFPGACRAAKTAEAAGQLGGMDAYWKMHIWIMEHQKEFSDAAVRAVAPSMGLDPATLMAKIDSPEVSSIVGNDAGIGFRIGIPEIPRIFINGKLLPRWNIPNQFLIERVIEEAGRPPAPVK